MKTQLFDLLQKTLSIIQTQNIESNFSNVKIQITGTKKKEHGDYATNLSMQLASVLRKSPRDIASIILNNIPENDIIKKTEIAGAGFINFFINHSRQFQIVTDILSDIKYGKNIKENPKNINIEFVSANPTGPLHVGHGRGAAIGSVIANLLENNGDNITREYYVNDAGRQMDILAISVYLRYLTFCNEIVNFPSNAYKGVYIKIIAKQFYESYQCDFGLKYTDILKDVFADFNELNPNGDKEKHIDGIIQNIKTLLGSKYEILHQFGLNIILEDIKSDLKDFEVPFDKWFSEKSLVDNDSIKKALDILDKKGYLYTKKGAIWFKSTDFGDDKDRVVVRDNGQTTYFASDAAYVANKFKRGFDKLIYIFGADHHGYVARLRALASAFGHEQSAIDIPLVQFAVLYENGEKVQMSTRSGSFVTLRELRENVGNDATRLFYIMRKADQHLDFDLTLAKTKSNENPVFYIQYAHARICSVLIQIEEKDIDLSTTIDLSQLNSPIESEIALKLSSYLEVLKTSSNKLEPHLLINYLRELAVLLHSYYNSEKFIIQDNIKLMSARIALISAVKRILKNAFHILAINSPDRM